MEKRGCKKVQLRIEIFILRLGRLLSKLRDCKLAEIYQQAADKSLICKTTGQWSHDCYRYVKPSISMIFTREKTFFLFVLLWFGSNAFGQETSDAVWLYRDTTATQLTVKAKWKNKEWRPFRVSKNEKRYTGDSLSSEKVTLDGIVHLKVLDSTENSYQLEWRMSENLRDTSHDPELDKSLLPSMNEDDMALRFTTDADGGLTAYQNAEEIQVKLDSVMGVIMKPVLAELSKKNGAGTDPSKLESVVRDFAGGKQLFDNLYNAFVGNLFELYGYTTGVDDTLNYKQTNPALVGDQKIVSDVYVFVTAVDTLEDKVRFDIQRYADISGLTQSSVEKIGGAVKKETDVGNYMSQSIVTSETYVTYLIDMKTGWPTYFRLVRDIIFEHPDLKQTQVKQDIWTMDSDLKEKP